MDEFMRILQDLLAHHLMEMVIVPLLVWLGNRGKQVTHELLHGRSEVDRAITQLTESTKAIQDTLASIQTELKSRAEVDQLHDAAEVFNMRRHLISDHKRLTERGWASYRQRRDFHDAYDLYEALCERSGTHNGVLEGYLDDIDNLPQDKDHLNEGI